MLGALGIVVEDRETVTLFNIAITKFDEDEGTNTIVNVTKPDRSDVGVKTNNKKDAGGTVIIVCVVLLALILLCQGLYRYGKKHHWIKEGDKVYEMANYESHMPDKIVLRKAKLEVHDHNVQTVRTVMGPGILLASRADGVHIVQLSSWHRHSIVVLYVLFVRLHFICSRA